MAGATKAQVPERLAIYHKIRHHRASAIQILSNYGFDQKPPEEVMDYLDGQALPSELSSCNATPSFFFFLNKTLTRGATTREANAEETFKFNYRVDAVQRVIDHMMEYDPSFRVPRDFFPSPEKLNQQPMV